MKLDEFKKDFLFPLEMELWQNESRLTEWAFKPSDKCLFISLSSKKYVEPVVYFNYDSENQRTLGKNVELPGKVCEFLEKIGAWHLKADFQRLRI